MSFVYACYCDDGFSIIADTKIGINDRLLKLWPSETLIQDIKQYGIIKNIILNPHLVLCFAGNNIALADQLLEYYKKENVGVDKLIGYAHSIHSNAEPNAIEFIIAYCDNKKRRIISIKNGEISEDSFAWIGSPYVYREYRKRVTEKYPLGIQSVDTVRLLVEQSIKSGVDDSVGGYIINVKYLDMENSFQYMEHFEATTGFNEQYILPGESIKFVQGVEEGSYTYWIYQSPERVALYLLEPQYGIIYTCCPIDEKSTGMNNLFLPRLLKMDQLDFDVCVWQLRANRGILFGNYNYEDMIKEIEVRQKNYLKDSEEYIIYNCKKEHLQMLLHTMYD